MKSTYVYSINIKMKKFVTFSFMQIVDDLLFASNSLKMIEEAAEKINKKFKMKCLGEVNHYLRIEIEKDEKGHFMISQSYYIDEIVSKFGLKDAKMSKFPLDSNEDYRKMTGKLFYVSSQSRPDITSSVKILCFQEISN